MPLQSNAVMTFTSYKVLDIAIELHFECHNPGPGEVVDYYILITDTEIAALTSLSDFATLVDAKLKRKLRGLNIANRLDALIGQSRVI